MTIGERMKAKRKEVGLSAEEVAKSLNVSTATIYRYEKGDIEKLPGSILEPLSHILHTTPAYLMGWETNESSHYNYLINTYMRGIMSWSANKLSNPQDTEVYRMHFSDLLLRYKTLVEHAVYARSNTEKYIDSIRKFNSERTHPLNEQQLTEQYLRQELQDDLNDLISWINALPMYLSKENQHPDS